MKASIVDLRYRMKDVLKALDRGETVRVMYHGKEKALMVPSRKKSKRKMEDSPFFGLQADLPKDAKSVQKYIREMRKPRYADL